MNDPLGLIADSSDPLGLLADASLKERLFYKGSLAKDTISKAFTEATSPEKSEASKEAAKNIFATQTERFKPRATQSSLPEFEKPKSVFKEAYPEGFVNEVVRTMADTWLIPVTMIPAWVVPQVSAIVTEALTKDKDFAKEVEESTAQQFAWKPKSKAGKLVMEKLAPLFEGVSQLVTDAMEGPVKSIPGVNVNPDEPLFSGKLYQHSPLERIAQLGGEAMLFKKAHEAGVSGKSALKGATEATARGLAARNVEASRGFVPRVEPPVAPSTGADFVPAVAPPIETSGPVKTREEVPTGVTVINTPAGPQLKHSSLVEQIVREELARRGTQFKTTAAVKEADKTIAAAPEKRAFEEPARILDVERKPADQVVEAEKIITDSGDPLGLLIKLEEYAGKREETAKVNISSRGKPFKTEVYARRVARESGLKPEEFEVIPVENGFGWRKVEKKGEAYGKEGMQEAGQETAVRAEEKVVSRESEPSAVEAIAAEGVSSEPTQLAVKVVGGPNDGKVFLANKGEKVHAEVYREMQTKDLEGATEVVSGWARPDKSGFVTNAERAQALGAEAEARARMVEITGQAEATKEKSGTMLFSQKGAAGVDLTPIGEPFYSKLEQVVDAKMQGRMPVEQLRKMLKGNGVSDAEIESVLGGIVSDVKGNVTKQQVLDALVEKGVKFEDVELIPTTELTKYKEQTGDFAKGITKFDQYVEPGAVPGSYREMFVTTPSREAETKFFDTEKEALAYADQHPDIHYKLSQDSKYKIFDYEELPPNMRYLVNQLYKNEISLTAAKKELADHNWEYLGGRRFKILNAKEYRLETQTDWQDGHSAYSDIQNPIVRIRFNERNLPRTIDQKRTLEARNKQSQYWWKKDFNDITNPAQRKEIEEFVPEQGKKILFVEEIQGPSEANQAKMPEALRKRIYDIGVKRILAYAKENGFDGVAWTTGKMQADRYSLSKQVDKLSWSPDSSVLRVYKNNDVVLRKVVEEKDLPEVIGKEASRKLVEAPLTIIATTDRPVYAKVLSGLDLEIGGEGLKRLYDETLPSLFKKYGKEGVETVDLQLRPTVTRQGLEIPGAGPQETLVPYTSISSKTPSSYTFYSGVDLTQVPQVYRNLKSSAKKLYAEMVPVKTRTNLERTSQAFQELVLNPDKIMHRDPYAKETYKVLANAEEAKNAFLWRNYNAFKKATEGIKKDSDSSRRIGRALDRPEEFDAKNLTQQEKKAYDFLKQNFDALITEYARRAAGSEESYQKVLRYVESAVKEERKSKVSELNAEDRAVYDELKKQAAEIKGKNKVSDLKGNEYETYQELQQQMRDLRAKTFKSTLTEGELEAYNILSRKIKNYLPHMFDQGEILDYFTVEKRLAESKLAKATKKGSITVYKNRINQLDEAITKLKGGELVTFEQLPSDVFFRFFSPRKGAAGYSFDAMRAYESYLFGIARKMFDGPAVKRISGELYNKISPEYKPYAKALVRHYMGYDSSPFNWLANGITSFEWMRTLGLNPRSAIVNLTQRFNTAAWIGLEWAGKAEKMMLFDYAKAKALFDESGLGREVPQVMVEGSTPVNLAKVKNLTGVIFNKVETGNRMHSFLAGYLKATAEGKSHAQAIKEGIKVTHKTQFRYGKLGMPKMFWNPAVRVGLQFSSYPIKQLQFLYDLWHKDKASFLKWIAYTEGANVATQKLLNSDISNALGIGITWSEFFRALESLKDADTDAAWRHLLQTLNLGSGLLPSGPGPAASSIAKVASKYKEGPEEISKQFLRELEPVQMQRIRKAVEAVLTKRPSQEKYTITDTKGHALYKLTGPELALRTLGPKTATEGKQQREHEEDINLQLERKQGVRNIIEAMVDGDKEAVKKAIKDHPETALLILKSGSISQLMKNEILRRELTRKERETKPSINVLYKLLREGKVSEFD